MEYVLDNGKMRKTFPMRPEDKDKYIIVAVAKKEGLIAQWVKHHLDLGFDKIFIGDNNDDDSMKIALKEYTDNGTVELFDVRGWDHFQSPFYTMFCMEGNYKWAAYLDCDEYLKIRNYDSVKEFLDTRPECDCIYINWMVMSNQGQFYNDAIVSPQVPKLPLLYDFNNYIIKTIVNGKFHNEWDTHMPCGSKRLLLGGYKERYFDYHTENNITITDEPYYKEAWIEHYNTTTLENLAEKINRGYPDDNVMSLIGAASQYAYHSVNQNAFVNYPEIHSVYDKTLQYKNIGYYCDDNNYVILLALTTLLKYRHDITLYVGGAWTDQTFNLLLDFNYNYIHNNNTIKWCDSLQSVKFWSEYYFS